MLGRAGAARGFHAAATSGPEAAPAPAAPAATTLSTDERLAQLNELAALKGQGILTDAEFAAEKARILGF